MKPISKIVLLSFVISCGKAPEMAKSTSSFTTLPLDGSNVDGAYHAEFITLNTGINGFLTPAAFVERKDDEFKVYVKMNKSTQGWHQQDIYLGERCPTATDDTNGDGLIDVVEGKKAWGNIFIPLDGDINSQNEGQNLYPTRSEYYYHRSASFSKIFSDLQSVDQDETDNIVKLGPNTGMAIENKVIVILGVNDSVFLPSTVATLNNLSPHNTFPIVCGLFVKTEKIPTDFVRRTTSDSLGLPGTSAPVPTPIPTPPVEDNSIPGRFRNWWRRNWGGGGNP